MYGIQVQRVAVIQKIIAVCCVLHNICIDMGDVEVDDLWLPNDLPAPQPDQDTNPQQIEQEIIVRRNAVDVIVDIFVERQQQ